MVVKRRPLLHRLRWLIASETRQVGRSHRRSFCELTGPFMRSMPALAHSCGGDYVGFDHEATPLPMGDDVVAVDASRGAVVRLDGVTGRVRWRLELGDSLLAPVLWDANRILVAARSGKLWIVDAETGTAPGFIQFSQALPVPPYVDSKNQRALWSASIPMSICWSVRNCSARTSIISAIWRARLQSARSACWETSSSPTTSVSIRRGCICYRCGRTGRSNKRPNRSASMGMSRPRRPSLVEGSRVVTDRARSEPSTRQQPDRDDRWSRWPPRAPRAPGQRFCLLHQGRLWIAGAKLSKFVILPTGDRFQAEDLPDALEGSAFDGPLQVRGDFVIQVRRRAAQQGATVAAVNAQDGHVVWQTQVATPPAGEPIVDTEQKEIVVASQNGQVFQLGQKAIDAGVQDSPLEAKGVPRPIRIESHASIGNQISVFASHGQKVPAGLLRLQSEGKTKTLDWLPLPSPMASAPVPFANGLLCPLQVGQVVLIDPSSGSVSATFQPPIELQQPVQWSQPGLDAGGKRFAIADRNGALYLVEVVAGDKQRLGKVAEVGPLPSPVVTAAAVVGKTVVVGTADGRLRPFSIPGLEKLPEIDLGEQTTWGPFVIGDCALVATEGGNLYCISADGKRRWQSQEGQYLPVGRPLAVSDDVVLAMADGTVQRIGLGDGKVLGSVAVGQPLGAGPVTFGPRLLLTTYDGTLLVINRP